MDIVILGFRGCLGSAFIGAGDLLTLSRRMLVKPDQPRPYEVLTASYDGRPVQDGAGRKLEVDRSFEELDASAAIIVPAYLCNGSSSPDYTEEIAAAADRVSVMCDRRQVKMLEGDDVSPQAIIAAIAAPAAEPAP